jgi:SAM-dependent methyltransferase
MKTIKIRQQAGERSAADHFINYICGTIQPECLVMELLLATASVETARDMLMFARTNFPAEAAVEHKWFVNIDTAIHMMKVNEIGCERIAQMVSSGATKSINSATLEEGIRNCRMLFDRMVAISEEASVAFHSLGNPMLLEYDTARIVDILDSWGYLTPITRVLDVGCGIGRFASMFGQLVESVDAVDISQGMIDAARRRCGSNENIAIRLCSGADLNHYDNESFDLVFACDVFPYIVQVGHGLVDRYFEQIARVLSPGGKFVIVCFSYRENDTIDEKELTRLADEFGYDIIGHSERPAGPSTGAFFRLTKKLARSA